MHRKCGEGTPHPNESGLSRRAALSHKGRGHNNGRHGLFLQVPHSAASANGADGARSTTFSVVRMRCVVPS